MKTIRIAALVSCLLGASVAFAQPDAHVSGTVTDPTGANVVGATVTALDTTTGVSTPVTTNAAGVYTMPGLLPGRYNFTAEHGGFRKSVREGVILETGSVLTLNMGLEIGASTQTVEVQAEASEVAATSSNVQTVVDGKRLLDLPLNGRSSYSLVATQPGVVDSSQWYVNGTQVGATNVTMDGITNMDQFYGGGTGYLYVNISSVDRVQEVQVVTSPADAEYGRGSGQIQVATRAGTSRYVGSAYEELRNKVFNANNFFNNAAGSYPSGAPLRPISNLDKHVYGIRFGGPFPKYLKNKLFFNGITEPQRESYSTAVNQTVFTAPARQGIFRFYPGVTNGNAQTIVPTVDLAGNPVQPAAATGPLQSVNVLGRDPNRLVLDPTGVMQHVLSYVPLPNNYLIGDGLNTAGYTWQQPGSDTYGLYEGRIDYNASATERLMLRLSHSSYHAFSAEPPAYPGVPWGSNPGEYSNYAVALTSILRPNLLNEVRIGIFRPRGEIRVQYDPYNLTGGGASIANRNHVKDFLPVIDGVASPLYTIGVTSPYGSASPGNYINPNYQYGDNITWIKGKHSFKGGVQVRLISSAGFPFSVNQVPPLIYIGQPAATPVTNIATGTNPIAGIGTNATTANNLLFNLTGSVAYATELNISTGGKNPIFLPGLNPYRSWHQNEMDWFFKDEWKVTPSLTLNLGVRWELYRPPVEAQGRGIAPVGGSSGLFGISGASMAALFNPSATGGSPTVIQGVGPGTANPNIPFYRTDYKNYSPNVGLAWAVPGEGFWKWLSGGPNKMTIRIGYGIGYQHLPIYLANTVSGQNQGAAETDTETAATSIANLVLPVQPAGTPLAPVPLTGPGSHTNNLYAYDFNLRNPYTQNYNITVARALTNSIVMTLAFVGSKSSELIRTADTNEVNIYENGLLPAFNTVLAGGDSPLIDRIFSNSYAAVAAAGNGSNYVRTNSTTNVFLANNNPGGLANYISSTTALTGVAGGLLSNAGLPLNFIVANPQFLHTYLTGNFANSTYNSLQVQVSKRFSDGFALQSSFVWSHALGDNPGDSPSFTYNYRTLRNESLDKGPLSFDYQTVYRINGLYELPFGKGKLIGRNANGFLDRIIGGWELGAIGFAQSGQPLTFIAQNTINNTTGYSGIAGLIPYNAFVGFTPVQVGALPTAGVSKTGNGVLYFSGLTQIPDPSIANINGAALQRLSTLFAIASSNGAPLLVNPQPGILGSLAQGSLRGPGSKGVNVNLIKHIRINERFTFQLGATAQNLTNTPIFGTPNTNINSTAFGRITTTAGTYPSRLIVLQARLNF
jgi:hypothetical protein